MIAAGNDPFVLSSASFIFGHFGEDIDAALALMDRALAENRSPALAWVWSGLLRLYAGQPDAAIEQVDRALRLNPHDRIVAPLTAIGAPYLSKREFCYRGRETARLAPGKSFFALTYRLLAASSAHIGQFDEAHEIVEQLRA